MDLLLLDTEGFAVANVSEAYDARIFAASTVLSSLLLYNSMHLIDAKELEALDLLAHNTQLFTLKAVNDNTDSPDDDAATVAANVTAAFELRDVFQLPPLLWAVQARVLRVRACAGVRASKVWDVNDPSDHPHPSRLSPFPCRPSRWI